jgi:hypothetical protein
MTAKEPNLDMLVVKPTLARSADQAQVLAMDVQATQQQPVARCRNVKCPGGSLPFREANTLAKHQAMQAGRSKGTG